MLQREITEPRHGPAKHRPSHDDEAVDIQIARLIAADSELHAAAALLSDDERARAGRFVFDRDRRRFILGRSRLRQFLAARLDTAPAAIDFVHGTHGKPALAPSFASSELHFNLSHCGDVAVYAFTRGREIGVDVEAVRALSDADAIAARYFSRRECDEYVALPLQDRPLGFFNCWTRKEAFIKSVGDGLTYPLDAFDVSIAPGERPEIRRVRDTPGSCCGWSIDSFVPVPGYIAAVVIET